MSGKTQNYSVVCNCSICGKGIFIPVVNMWAYKRSDYFNNGNIRYFCSWGCMRKYDKDHEAAKLHKKLKAMRAVAEDEY